MPDQVTQLRLVLTVPDWDAAVAFYRDALGLPEEASFRSPGAQVCILSAGRATLEIADEGHAAYVDELEVGRRVAGPVRVAFEVADSVAVTEQLAAAGAAMVAPPTRTPWTSLNSRLDAPGGLHITVFADVRPEAERDGPEPMVGPHVTDPRGVRIALSEPDPAWPRTAAVLAAAVEQALGGRALLVEHVGSTSVPGLAAKPVVDLVLAVADPADEPAYAAALEGLGYVLRAREPDWHQHRLFKLTDPAVNLHVFGLGSVEIDRLLLFRDHLRRDPTDRTHYEQTKRRLARQTWPSVQHYADAKAGVVEEILARARAARQVAGRG